MKLIVEMEMPKACPCELATEIEENFYPCFAYYGVVERAVEFDYCVANVTRPDWCPIKGVLPEEHGDLIDRDEVKNELLKRMPMLCMTASGDNPVVCTRQEMLYLISRAKAVIAAERKDDD